MIGNDIVDLEQARQESNWRRNGFLTKVFTDYEQQLIQSTPDPDVMVWLLWSMKESAYKATVRETGQRFFAPQKLACYLTQTSSKLAEGSVFYQKQYSVRSIITIGYVASVAFSTDAVHPLTHEIVTFGDTDYRYQHEMIREKIKQYYVSHFPSFASDVQIYKDKAGAPMLTLMNSSGTITKLISLSHHGQYGAFASLP